MIKKLLKRPYKPPMPKTTESVKESLDKEFDDDSKMFFGLHRNKRLGDVPADYLLWWYNENTKEVFKVDSQQYKLRNYIESVLDELKKEKRPPMKGQRFFTKFGKMDKNDDLDDYDEDFESLL